MNRGLSRAAVVALFALGSLSSLPPARAARRDPPLVYDGEYGGYVPVVEGIERPDLVTDRSDGRVPEDVIAALKRTRRNLRRFSDTSTDGWSFTAAAPIDPSVAERPPSRRWLRRWAIVTQLEVHAPDGTPIIGARVYRFTDPTFYPVNQDESGARLFGAYRYLPAPFSAADALTAVELHEEHWQDLEFRPIAAPHPDLTERRNPWLRDGASTSEPPIEYVGTTNEAGVLTVVSGVFNLRNERRFKRAIVPEVLTLGLVVSADGFQTAVSTERLGEGGSDEGRAVTLLAAPDHDAFAGRDYTIAARALDFVALTEQTSWTAIEDAVDKAVAAAGRNLPPLEATTVSEMKARLLARLARRAPPALAERIARAAVDATPESAARQFRLAALLVARGGDALPEAQERLTWIVSAVPEFRPAWRALDDVHKARGARRSERLAQLDRWLAVAPFDRAARARRAVLALWAGRTPEALDHLRFTWAAAPGLGADRELSEALFDFYWRLGVPAKAGSYLWMLTGTHPEDPSLRLPRVNGATP